MKNKISKILILLSLICFVFLTIEINKNLFKEVSLDIKKIDILLESGKFDMWSYGINGVKRINNFPLLTNKYSHIKLYTNSPSRNSIRRKYEIESKSYFKYEKFIIKSYDINYQNVFTYQGARVLFLLYEYYDSKTNKKISIKKNIILLSHKYRKMIKLKKYEKNIKYKFANKYGLMVNGKVIFAINKKISS